MVFSWSASTGPTNWHPQRPFYVLRLAVVEPRELLHAQGALETPLVP